MLSGADSSDGLCWHLRRNRWLHLPAIARVYGIFSRLGECSKLFAGTMSGGEWHMLAMSRSLMLYSRLLLIDKVSMGLMP